MTPLVLSLPFALLLACASEDAAQKASGDNPERQIALGGELFKRNGCAVCHGQEGRGDGQVAKSLHPRPRDFRELSAYQQGSTQREIAATVKSGVGLRSSGMPAYPHLSEVDAAALGAFVVFLQSQP